MPLKIELRRDGEVDDLTEVLLEILKVSVSLQGGPMKADLCHLYPMSLQVCFESTYFNTQYAIPVNSTVVYQTDSVKILNEYYSELRCRVSHCQSSSFISG